MTIQLPVVCNNIWNMDIRSITHNLAEEYRQDKTAISVHNTLHLDIHFPALCLVCLGASRNKQFVEIGIFPMRIVPVSNLR